jgi:hypothetical protein
MFPQIKAIPQFYQDSIYAYAKSKEVKYPTNIDDILDQHLWGSRYITYQNNDNKRSALFFKSFIKCGIFKVKNLHFRNGILDENYIYENVKDKTNIFREISILRRALKPFKQYVGNHKGTTLSTVEQVTITQPNMYYTALINTKIETPLNENKVMQWCNQVPNDITFNNIYMRKIKQIKDFKIAEFNYKILHNILPCKANLKRWKICDNDRCNYCNEIQDIPHLLYNCKYSAEIWRLVERPLNTVITIGDVILGTDSKDDVNFVISVIAYIIYKHWLKCNANNHNTTSEQLLITLTSELHYRTSIYQHTKLRNVYEQMISVLNAVMI